jgi:excisionase family DNA binding protein
VNEVAHILGIDRSTLYRLMRDDDLPAVRVGKRLRFRAEDIEAYLERRREPAEPVVQPDTREVQPIEASPKGANPLLPAGRLRQ